MFWKKPSIRQLLPPPVQAAHGEYSMILSLYDDPNRPTPSLLKLSLDAISCAIHADLSDLSDRPIPAYTDVWPGEHYKLLSGITEALKPQLIIEIGTATGLSALCMKKQLPPSGKIVTFDIVPWNTYSNTTLTTQDFQSGVLSQIVADLSQPSIVQSYRDLLIGADLIFIDATHDGVLEERLMENFSHIPFRHPPYILFDDIRLWTMLKMWRNISYPKIDLTSFGHWSGTGLVEWTPNNRSGESGH
jgi:hypothetical protein